MGDERITGEREGEIKQKLCREEKEYYCIFEDESYKVYIGVYS